MAVPLQMIVTHFRPGRLRFCGSKGELEELDLGGFRVTFFAARGSLRSLPSIRPRKLYSTAIHVSMRPRPVTPLRPNASTAFR